MIKAFRHSSKLSLRTQIDEGEAEAIALAPEMVMAEVVGSSLKLNYCKLDRAIAFLKDQ